MKDLMTYIPKKYKHLVVDLYRERNFDGSVICCVMEWDDGYSRSLVCDSIDELRWAVKNTAEDREFQY